MAKIGDYFLIDSNGFYVAETAEAWRYQPSEYVQIPYPSNGGNYRWDYNKQQWAACYPVDENGIQIQTSDPAAAFAAPNVAPLTKDVRWDFIEQKWSDPRIIYNFVIDREIEETWLDGVKIRESYGILSLDESKKDMIRSVNTLFPQFFVDHDIRNLSVFGHDTVRGTFTAYLLDISKKYEAVSHALRTTYNRDVFIEPFEGYKLDLSTLQMNVKYFDKLLVNYPGYILPSGSQFDYAALYNDPLFSPDVQEIYFKHYNMNTMREWCINNAIGYSEDAFTLGAQYPDRIQFSIFFDVLTKQPLKFKQYYRIPFYTYNAAKLIHFEPVAQADKDSRIAAVDIFLAELGI